MFSGKRIVILNFANGGFKQPQQLLALSYFLSLGQSFDFVVNIDGFNEAYIPFVNHGYQVNAAMPSAYQIYSVQNYQLLQGADAPIDVIESVAYLRRIEKLRAANRSAALHYLLGAALQRTERKKVEQVAYLAKKLAGVDYIVLMIRRETKTYADRLDAIADLWVNASVAMDRLARSYNAGYLHVLQPNQYYSRKQFSDRKKSIAIDNKSDFAFFVPLAYPRLIKEAGTLRRSGVDFIDATAAFDGLSEVIYSDNCCHYNRLGKRFWRKSLPRQLSKERWPALCRRKINALAGLMK